MGPGGFLGVQVGFWGVQVSLGHSSWGQFQVSQVVLGGTQVGFGWAQVVFGGIHVSLREVQVSQG